jgi:chromate reductase, NAD(P)H dehydrogenase (quinone)
MLQSHPAGSAIALHNDFSSIFNFANPGVFMSTTNIAVVIGSFRKESFNKKLAMALQKLFPADFSFTQVRIDDLPLYNQDDDGNPAAQVKRLKDEIKAAQGVLFFTPEYNRSIPGVLKNAIDHASRPYGQSVWDGKPAGVIGVSVGATGTAMAQQHLRNILAYLNMPTLGQPEAFIHNKDGLYDAAGNVGPDSLKFLQSWVDQYVAWVKKHT